MAVNMKRTVAAVFSSSMAPYVAARALLTVVAAAPIVMLMKSRLANDWGLDARMADDAPPTFFRVVDMLTEGAGPLGAGIALSTLVLLFGGAFITAAALSTSSDGRYRLSESLGAIFTEGPRRIFAFTRVALFVLPILLVLMFAANFVVGKYKVALERSGATGLELNVTAPAAMAFLVVLAGALTGAIALFARTTLVVDDGRRARRAVLEGIRAMGRAPLMLLALPVVAHMGLDALGVFAAVSPGIPLPGATGFAWFVGFSVVDATVWGFLLVVFKDTYATARFDDARARSDRPLGVGATLRRIVGARRK